MNYALLFRTVKHLKPTQVYYQVKYRLKKPAYVQLEAPKFEILELSTRPIAKYNCVEGDKFIFLNLKHQFGGWNYIDNGMLWAYNQNYFDWINQEGYSKEDGCKWIDKFVEDLPSNRIGLDPYPIALRSINWIKFFCWYPESATKARLDSLYSQLRFLEKKLEYHLLGNHLLEDAYALYIGGAFFKDTRLLKKAERILLEQLKEQVLPDGAHYEQSPMYHCILLDRLLDCINIRRIDAFVGYAQRMLGHLESIIWADESIPKLNDSANGIAPSPTQIFNYARHLGLEWKVIPMKECGYRKIQNKHIEAIVDVCNITATYQPGHTHADTLSYELRIDGKPFIVDTGISTYNKTERRKYERSTVAHNTVSVDGNNSSEVWGGFRIGKRATVSLNRDEPTVIEATHDGFEKYCRRRFEMKETDFSVEDWYDGKAVSYIHLAHDVDKERIKVEGAKKIEVKEEKYSVEYNRFMTCMVMEIHFERSVKYTIR